MTCMTNARVDAHIDGLPEWQQAISREVRNLVHAAGPHVVEDGHETSRIKEGASR